MGDSFHGRVFDSRQVRRAFGRAAAGYDAASPIQREIESRLLESLDYYALRHSDGGVGHLMVAKHLGAVLTMTATRAKAMRLFSGVASRKLPVSSMR